MGCELPQHTHTHTHSYCKCCSEIYVVSCKMYSISRFDERKKERRKKQWNLLFCVPIRWHRHSRTNGKVWGDKCIAHWSSLMLLDRLVWQIIESGTHAIHFFFFFFSSSAPSRAFRWSGVLGVCGGHSEIFARKRYAANICVIATHWTAKYIKRVLFAHADAG